VERRRYEVRSIEPMDCGLPQVRSLVTVRKRCEPKRGGKVEESVLHYPSSLPPGGAERFAELVRGLWGGSEIRNHRARDGLIALKASLAPEPSWPELFEKGGMSPSHPTLPKTALRRSLRTLKCPQSAPCIRRAPLRRFAPRRPLACSRSNTASTKAPLPKAAPSEK